MMLCRSFDLRLGMPLCVQYADLTPSECWASWSLRLQLAERTRSTVDTTYEAFLHQQPVFHPRRPSEGAPLRVEASSTPNF